MYLGYDYPRYRCPSYAPWCTPAGVAAEVQYIHCTSAAGGTTERRNHLPFCSAEHRENDSGGSRHLHHTGFEAMGDTQAYTSSAWLEPAGQAARASICRSSALLAQPAAATQHTSRARPALRVFACRATRYRVFVDLLTAGLCCTSRPLVTIVPRFVATASRYRRQSPARCCPVSVRSADRPSDF